jgi:hypothetical protein
MATQDAGSTIADAPAAKTALTGADGAPARRLLIDGWLVTTDRTFGREMGVAGLEEFLERKTFAVSIGPAQPAGEARK